MHSMNATRVPQDGLAVIHPCVSPHPHGSRPDFPNKPFTPAAAPSATFPSWIHRSPPQPKASPPSTSAPFAHPAQSGPPLLERPPENWPTLWTAMPRAGRVPHVADPQGTPGGVTRPSAPSFEGRVPPRGVGQVPSPQFPVPLKAACPHAARCMSPASTTARPHPAIWNLTSGNCPLHIAPSGRFSLAARQSMELLLERPFPRGNRDHPA
jgi:hypothetical protein